MAFFKKIKKQINGVRVRFIPEKQQNSNNQVTSRSLVSGSIFWEEWGGKEPGTGGNAEDPTKPGGGETPAPEF